MDQLMVLKTSYLETRYMMNQTVAGKAPVMSIVAFRCGGVGESSVCVCMTGVCVQGAVPL